MKKIDMLATIKNHITAMKPLIEKLETKHIVFPLNAEKLPAGFIHPGLIWIQNLRLTFDNWQKIYRTQAKAIWERYESMGLDNHPEMIKLRRCERQFKLAGNSVHRPAFFKKGHREKVLKTKK